MSGSCGRAAPRRSSGTARPRRRDRCRSRRGAPRRTEPAPATRHAAALSTAGARAAARGRGAREMQAPAAAAHQAYADDAAGGGPVHLLPGEPRLHRLVVVARAPRKGRVQRHQVRALLAPCGPAQDAAQPRGGERRELRAAPDEGGVPAVSQMALKLVAKCSPKTTYMVAAGSYLVRALVSVAIATDHLLLSMRKVVRAPTYCVAPARGAG
eukprot:scaffold3725_cov376-Prasinococcus_capsulatus_cf.AAC.2